MPSEQQMTAAFNKALRQTVNALYRTSVDTMIKTTGAKNRKVVQGRMRRAVRNVGNSRVAGTGRIWFGLNDLPVSALKGTMKNPRGLRPQNRKRDVLGRFLPAKGGRGATFTPAGTSALAAKTFADSFVANIRNKRSIWIRNGSGRVNEARMAIHAQMNSAIEKNEFGGAADMLMDYFEKDLAGRVRGGVHLNSHGKRI
jgi:hypothetical protein